MRLPVCLGLALLAASPCAAQDYILFKSPSGNILCGIFDDDYPGARCDIRSLTPSFTRRPADCDLEWGSSFWIGADARRGEVACVGDIVGSADEAQVLNYGRILSFGSITCISEEIGVSCTNDEGHGFTIAKARQQLY